MNSINARLTSENQLASKWRHDPKEMCVWISSSIPFLFQKVIVTNSGQIQVRQTKFGVKGPVVFKWNANKTLLTWKFSCRLRWTCCHIQNKDWCYLNCQGIIYRRLDWPLSLCLCTNGHMLPCLILFKLICSLGSQPNSPGKRWHCPKLHNHIATFYMLNM